MNYTATEIAKKLDISRSYLYYLKKINAVDVEETANGRTLWDEKLYMRLSTYLVNKRKIARKEQKRCSYKTIKINNRRYLGNKYRLLPFIKSIINNECTNINTVADIFAGTGAVASAFTDKKIITNDIMYSNYICHYAWFINQEYSKEKIVRLIKTYNEIKVYDDNYVSSNFANTYFDIMDCRKIGFIREDIEIKYNKKLINERERALLITSLLYAMDKIANTCGHYDAYRKSAEFERHLELSVPEPVKELNENNLCYNMDTNILASEIEADLVYIDPPYNSRQYCDAYHLLENIARWEKPEVFGVAKKMDRRLLKSDYCTQKATQAFESLVNTIHARYILLSYNNMAEKGNERSNAKISDTDIIRILEKKGHVKVFTENHKAFSAGKSTIKDNQERLFLCECFQEQKDIIPSALNYTGGKFKLLPQILPHFPDKVDKVVDLFCGGCNVGINTSCNRVHFIDSNEYVIGVLDTFKKMAKKDIFECIYTIINKYKLSLVAFYGYEYYNCNSSKGLATYNRIGFNKLRYDFNCRTQKDYLYYIMLYVLIVYSFNNQIRFSQKGDFNLPVGKRDFNSKMQKKLDRFIDRIKSGDYTFTKSDFRQISSTNYTDKTFVYVDPPYLISCAPYNEQGQWTEKDEMDLLMYLDQLDNQGVKFALSNVLESKNRKNNVLLRWIKKHGSYRVINLDYSYSNSNYHAKQRNSVTKEILVVNY